MPGVEQGFELQWSSSVSVSVLFFSVNLEIWQSCFSQLLGESRPVPSA